LGSGRAAGSRGPVAAAAAAAGPVPWLRRLHAGRVADSVVWITFGTAAIGAALALGLR
jgi:hypothetical protein